MDTRNNDSLGLRIAIGSGLVATGCAIAGPPMSSILQSQQAPIWAIVLMVIGVTAIISGLFILIIPRRTWKNMRLFILEFPQWLRETYIWRRHGPVSTIGKPEVTFILSEDKNTKTYKVKISLMISSLEKAKDYYPIRVLVDKETTKFRLEQSRGGVKLSPISLELVTGTFKQTLINTPDDTPIDLVFSQSLYNNPAIASVDIKKPPYMWRVEGIEMYLANIRKIRKLSRSGKVSKAERGEANNAET